MRNSRIWSSSPPSSYASSPSVGSPCAALVRQRGREAERGRGENFFIRRTSNIAPIHWQSPVVNTTILVKSYGHKVTRELEELAGSIHYFVWGWGGLIQIYLKIASKHSACACLTWKNNMSWHDVLDMFRQVSTSCLKISFWKIFVCKRIFFFFTLEAKLMEIIFHALD